MEIQRPIETWYENQRFKTRGEARFRMLTGLIGVDAVYEPQGWATRDSAGTFTFYSPDFWLPDIPLVDEMGELLSTGMTVEVKGQPGMADVHKVLKALGVARRNLSNPFPGGLLCWSIMPPQLLYGHPSHSVIEVVGDKVLVHQVGFDRIGDQTVLRRSHEGSADWSIASFDGKTAWQNGRFRRPGHNPQQILPTPGWLSEAYFAAMNAFVPFAR